MHLEILHTATDVFEALGGNSGLEALTGSKPSAVSMWKKAGSFPSNTYVVLTEALRAVGKTAPDALWGMKSACEPERAA
jgi:hypothetical protein